MINIYLYIDTSNRGVLPSDAANSSIAVKLKVVTVSPQILVSWKVI